MLTNRIIFWSKLNRILPRCKIEGRYYSSSDSFMQTVINQVKKDLEKDVNLKEAIQQLEDEAKISQRIIKIRDYIKKSKEFSTNCLNKLSENKDKSRLLNLCMKTARNVAIGIDRVSNILYDEQRPRKLVQEKWKYKINTMSTSDNKDIESVVSNTYDNALILAEESAWDKFGSRLRDMPFLNKFFGSGVFTQIFGESTLSNAISEMKNRDSSFNIPELVELVEYVVAPHIVECYLNGDSESLKIHCGECAFNILEESIKERNLQKLKLDPTILILKDVELKGGMCMENDYPWFIFNFTTQQINCIRDYKNKIIAGEEDDIREVTYSIAVSKRPIIAEVDKLQYPYIVNEIAIISNQPCW